MDRIIAMNSGLKKWGSDSDVTQLNKNKSKNKVAKKAKNTVNLFKNTFTKRLRSNSQPTRPPDLDNDKENKDNGNTERCDSADTLDATTEPNVNDNKQNQDHKKSLKERLWNYYHRNEGKPNKKQRKKKLSLDETQRFPRDDEKKGSLLLYVDYSKDTMVTTDKTGDKNANEERHNSDVGQEKRKRSAPVGTIQYTVKDRETIESIAAHFDTTPSQLKKVNRLISPMIFAGQVIYIPDKDYVPPPSARSSISSEPMDTANKSPQVTPVGSPEIRPTMDVPMVRAANKPPDVVPGHAERSPTEEVEFEIVPPTKLSADEVQQLDQDCMERFIKLKVKHITDGQGVVKGTLLVTPNAVMFDPDVLDPLVVEHGAEKYGMIAPMDMIISAAMYHDIAVMKLRGKVQPDGTMYPKPEVYHDKTCPLYKARQNSKDNEVEDSDDKVGDLVNLAETKRKIFSDTKSDSVCSCGGIDNKEKDALLTLEDDKLNEPDALGGEVNHGRNADEANDTDIKGGELLSTSGETEMQHMECDKTEDVTNTLDVFESSSKKTSSPKSSHVAFCLADVESSRKQNSEVLSEDVLKTDNSVNEIPNKSMNRSDVFEELDKVTRNTDNVNEDKDTDNKKIQIGSIVYLPVEEDSEGKVTLQSLEATQNTLSKLSTEAFEQTSKSETNLSGNFPRSENQDIEKKRSASTSSLGPFSPSPHLSAFVNYATGFFSRTESQKEIKDIQDVVPDFKMEEPKRSSDIPVIAAAPTAGKRRGKISRHSNSNQEVEVESAMKMTEKLEDLFSVDYDTNNNTCGWRCEETTLETCASSKGCTSKDYMVRLHGCAEFKPRKSVAYSDPPLYLCLRLGMPQNKVFHNYSIESYGKRRKKSEYWFSIPREKVDHLYAFFVQWTPEIYGDQEDIDPEKRGFVVIPDNEDGDDDDSLEVLDEYFGQNSVFHKDWEIISKIEAIKRRSIVFEEPLPLPELNGQSTILDDALILQLSQVIPPRTVGYPWTLIYSTDKHGFSLKTLYRDMAGLDSPILLVVKDTQDHVFGALTSCELKISDHFYGTGETFLYTFYPEFQVFNWSGDNNFFMKGNKESLSIGAGQGVFGLWFDGDLYHGRTHKCDTFNNDMLTSSEDFVVKAFEAWAFVQD